MLIADRPEFGLLLGSGEAGAELHAAAAVRHRDRGMLYEVGAARLLGHRLADGRTRKCHMVDVIARFYDLTVAHTQDEDARNRQRTSWGCAAVGELRDDNLWVGRVVNADVLRPEVHPA
jgi:hypothetical protein